MAIEPHVLTFLRDFGLILFIFFIGLQVGPFVFRSFKSGGIILNGLAAGAIVLSILVTILLWALTAGLIDLPTMLGVHFGAVTNTPGLGATQEALAVMGWQERTLRWLMPAPIRSASSALLFPPSLSASSSA